MVNATFYNSYILFLSTIFKVQRLEIRQVMMGRPLDSTSGESEIPTRSCRRSLILFGIERSWMLRSGWGDQIDPIRVRSAYKWFTWIVGFVRFLWYVDYVLNQMTKQVLYIGLGIIWFTILPVSSHFGYMCFVFFNITTGIMCSWRNDF